MPPTTISFGAIMISGGAWTIGAEGFLPHPVAIRVRKMSGTIANVSFRFKCISFVCYRPGLAASTLPLLRRSRIRIGHDLAKVCLPESAEARR